MAATPTPVPTSPPPPTCRLVVYDLEYTSWEGARERRWNGPGEHREIVQLGAIRLVDGVELSILVRPRINFTLSAYFVDLTGISQARMDEEGIDFPMALACFADFAGDALLLSNGRDEEVLRENCRLTGIEFPFGGRCRDIAAVLSEAAGHREQILSCEMGRAFGLDLNETAHDALGDARQVAAAVRLLAAAGHLGL